MAPVAAPISVISRAMTPLRPFSALRVLDLSTEIAGPYATKLLCDQGADVIKVEEAPGDPLRRRTAARIALPHDTDSALFQFLNAGKRAALCDPGDAAQRARLRELAREADVVVSSSGLVAPAWRAERI